MKSTLLNHRASMITWTYREIVRISFSLLKSALLTYIGRLEVDKAAFPKKNR